MHRKRKEGDRKEEGEGERRQGTVAGKTHQEGCKKTIPGTSVLSRASEKQVLWKVT